MNARIAMKAAAPPILAVLRFELGDLGWLILVATLIAVGVATIPVVRWTQQRGGSQWIRA